MSPGDFKTDVTKYLNDCFYIAEFKEVKNPNKKWFQFWKPNVILVEVQGDDHD